MYFKSFKDWSILDTKDYYIFCNFQYRCHVTEEVMKSNSSKATLLNKFEN